MTRCGMPTRWAMYECRRVWVSTPLRALGLQPVGEEREVDRLEAAAPRRALERMERVGEDRLRVEQQAADERALAVVDAAAGEKAQQAVLALRGERGFAFDGDDSDGGG